MTRQSDGSIEREQAQLASQQGATLQQRVYKLERQCDALQSQLRTVLAILDAQGSQAAHVARATFTPEEEAEFAHHADMMRVGEGMRE